MATSYDCSSSAQHAALGRTIQHKPVNAERPLPSMLQGLAGLGAYVGAADIHPPRKEEPAIVEPQSAYFDEDLSCDA
jgi:hypothetical protein